jgi:hypothetical protein
MNDKKEKTAVGKLRDRYFLIKKSITPSTKLKEMLEEDKKSEQSENLNKKVARPYNPRNEADV